MTPGDSIIGARQLSGGRAVSARGCICRVALIALAARVGQAQSCEYRNWSAPRMVGQRVVARDPSVTRVGDRMYFAGSNTPRFDSLPPADSLLTLVDREGTPLPRPAGHDVFMLPRVARLTDSAFVMMWGEPDSVPTDHRLPPWTNVARLWAATWDSRRGWTEAHPLLAGAPVAWTEEVVTGPITRDGDVLLAIPHRKGLQYLRYHEGMWRGVLIPLASSTAYASVATDPRTADVLIAYIAAVPDAMADANSVFVIRSENGGASWSAPTLVSRSGGTPAFDVSLLNGLGGRMQLVWMQDQTGDLVPEVIRRVESTDGGRTWQSPNDLRLPPGTRALKAVADACGALHVIYKDWRGGGTTGHLDYARFTGDRWSAIEHLLPQATVVSGSLASLDSADVLLVFLSRQDATDPREPLRLRYSRLAVHARESPN